jgi:raffinose/stachyose/melibiose transport system substrate-binding protein
MKWAGLSAALLAVFTLSLLAEGLSEGSPRAPVPVIRVLGEWSDSSKYSTVRREIIADWQDAHPEVLVDDQSVSQEDIFNDIFKTALAAGSVPDIVVTTGAGNMRAYVENKVFIDLEPLLSADRKWYDSFEPSSFDNWRFPGIPGTYGVPEETYAVGLYVNRSLFARYGIKMPATVEELAAACDGFLSRGLTPMLLGAKDKWRGSYLFSNLAVKYLGPGSGMSLAARKTSWTDPEVVRLLELLSSWNRKGYFGRNAALRDYEEEKTAFLQGQTAMLADGNLLLGELPHSPVSGDVTFQAFPYFAERPVWRDAWMGGGAGAFSVASPPGQRRDAALSLVKWSTSRESFLRLASAAGGGLFPVDPGLNPADVSSIARTFREVVSGAGTKATELSLYDPLVQVSERARAELQSLFAGNTARSAAEAIQKLIDESRAQGLP